MNPPVEVDADIQSKSANLFYSLDSIVENMRRIDPIELSSPVHLNSSKSLFTTGSSTLDNICRRISSDPTVHFDLVSDFSPKKLINGYS